MWLKEQRFLKQSKEGEKDPDGLVGCGVMGVGHGIRLWRGGTEQSCVRGTSLATHQWATCSTLGPHRGIRLWVASRRGEGGRLPRGFLSRRPSRGPSMSQEATWRPGADGADGMTLDGTHVRSGVATCF